MSEELTEIRFWTQVMGDAKRTVICNPDLESRVKGWIDARGMGGLITVQATPICPINRTYIVDEQALQASLNEVLSRPIKIDWRAT